MKSRQWRALSALLLAAGAAILTIWFRPIPAMSWPGTARWQLVYECVGAAIALEVALFALSRFSLEQRRLPLFIGLGYLSAAIANLVAALLCQGNYIQPLVGETQALTSVAAAGSGLLAVCLWGGLLTQQYWPTAPSATRELVPITLIGASCAFAVVQLAQIVPLPDLLRLRGAVHRPWDLGAAMLLSAALPGYWKLYRKQGGPIIQTVLVSLVLGIISQIFMAQSAVLYDSSWNAATLLKVTSYIPLLVGLFIASVTSFRAQQRLTNQLQVAQAELSAYSKQLEKKVAERTRDLEARSKELEAFAYTVSHDLKAPLRGIQAYSQFLLEGYGSKLDDTGRRYASSVCKAAVNMKQLIDDLLEYTRLDRREAEMGPVDLANLTDSVIAERQSQIEQAHAQLEVDLPLPLVTGDRAMLRAAIANLVDNAIKFSRDAKPPRVVVRGRQDNGGYLLSITDNGVGFEPKDRDHIFEIFHRLHSQEEFEGTGIGLCIVKRAVEKHGGRVWAESQPGCGATFNFTIPQHEGAAS